MTSFCKQCSEKIFGEDFGDLKGLTTEEVWKEGKAALVLCEECGKTQVDPEGRCIGKCDDPSHDKKGEMNVFKYIGNM